MFSGTSSQIHHLIEATVPLLISDDDIDENIKESLRNVVDYSDPANTFFEANDETPNETAEQETDNDDEENEIEENISTEQQEAQNWIETLIDPNCDTDNEFQDELPTMNAVIIAWIVHLLVADNSAFKLTPKTSNVGKLRDWLERPRVERPFFMMKKASLVEYAKQQKIKINKQQPKQKIIERIVEELKKRKENPNGAHNDIGDETNVSLAPLVAILKFSFLQPQESKSDRSAAKIGHRNEEIFLNKFFDLYASKQFILPSEFPLFGLVTIYRPGLIEKKNTTTAFIKDSADGIAVFKMDETEVRTKFLQAAAG